MEVEQKIIGSIFPRKLIFDGKKYRTTQVNEAKALLASNRNGFGELKKEKAGKISGQSYGVPPVGVEPTHLAPEASALSTELRGRTYQGILRPSH